METGQAKLLQRFSERLHQLAAARKDPANAVYGDLAALAAVDGRSRTPRASTAPARRRTGRGRRGPEGHEVGRTGTLLRTPLAGGELSPRRILHQDPGTLPLFRGAAVVCHRGLPAEVGGGDAPRAPSRVARRVRCRAEAASPSIDRAPGGDGRPDAQERGELGMAFLLGRVRRSKPADLAWPPRDLGAGDQTPLDAVFSSYRSK